MRKIRAVLVVVVVAAFTLACQSSKPPAAPQPSRSADAAARLTALYAGPGVMLRGPENCIAEKGDPWEDPATISFCAVKDVFGALGGPSSGAAPTDFIKAANRFEFSQPTDCPTVGAIADGKHDNCAVLTGAVTLLRAGSPVRLFGVCAKAVPKDCAVLGTITDPNWAPEGVYLLMDPAKVKVHCQYAQDADRNGCNEGAAYTAGQSRPLCSANAADPMCQYGPDQTEQMLAAYSGYCTRDAANCLENQLEAQWGPDAIIATSYLDRIDQPSDCADAQRKAQRFADAMNTAWSTNVPTVRISLDVAANTLEFTDTAVGCKAHG